jgi:CRISPR/Cas system-associated exonuclease Cas4 (RecB family)
MLHITGLSKDGKRVDLLSCYTKKDKQMTDPKELLLTALRAGDAKRSRSTQVQIGPSEVGGCRRKVWYRLNDQPETNDNELKLAAIMGTAIHAEIERALADNPDVLIETEVEYNGMKAHIDCFVPGTGDVIDWKTSKVRNLSYFPTNQQRWQVQLYGYLLAKNGYAVNRVSLVAIARDGDERDVKVHTEDYNEAIALEALGWLAAVKEAKEAPAPEKDASYCQHYCKFYDASGQMGCVGLKKERTSVSEVIIADEDIDKNALLYLQLAAQIKELETQQDSLKASFEGVLGTTNSGIELSWTTVKGRESVDSDEVEKLLGFVPKKVGAESQRLSIKQSGGK